MSQRAPENPFLQLMQRFVTTPSRLPRRSSDCSLTSGRRSCYAPSPTLTSAA